MATKAPVQSQGFPVRVQGYLKSFRIEFDLTTEDITIEDLVSFIDMLEEKGFKGTTFEKKETSEALAGKIGNVDKIEKTKTKNGKDAFLAHIMIDGRDTPVSIMFFNPGECRKGDRVKIKMDNGYVKFELVDENGEAIPF